MASFRLVKVFILSVVNYSSHARRIQGPVPEEHGIRFSNSTITTWSSTSSSFASLAPSRVDFNLPTTQHLSDKTWGDSSSLGNIGGGLLSTQPSSSTRGSLLHTHADKPFMSTTSKPINDSLGILLSTELSKQSLVYLKPTVPTVWASSTSKLSSNSPHPIFLMSEDGKTGSTTALSSTTLGGFTSTHNMDLTLVATSHSNNHHSSLNSIIGILSGLTLHGSLLSSATWGPSELPATVSDFAHSLEGVWSQASRMRPLQSGDSPSPSLLPVSITTISGTSTASPATKVDTYMDADEDLVVSHLFKLTSPTVESIQTRSSGVMSTSLVMSVTAFVEHAVTSWGSSNAGIIDTTTVVGTSSSPASRLLLVDPLASTPTNSVTLSSGFSHNLITASKALSSGTRSHQLSDSSVADDSTSSTLAHLSSSTVITANNSVSTANSPEGQTSSVKGRTAGIIVGVITVAGVSGALMMLMAQRLQRKRLKQKTKSVVTLIPSSHRNQVSHHYAAQ